MKIMSERKKQQSGLTLVEIIVVLVILSILIGFLTSSLFSQGEKAKAQINGLKMQKVKNAIGQYQLMYNQLPPDLNSLASCPTPGRHVFRLLTKIQLKTRGDSICIFL